jgi:hypothetical protein
VLVRLVLELVAGTARPVPARTPSLDHEVGDDAMKDQTVVELVVHVVEKILHRDRRLVGVELDLDVAFRRLENDHG